jgi:hypothetical protein
MSQQGPILVVSSGEQPSFAAALADMFPLIDAIWSEASGAIERLRPAAVLADGSEAGQPYLGRLAAQLSAGIPYTPLLVVDPKLPPPGNSIPFSSGGSAERLGARLRAALRVRSLHATVLRRLIDGGTAASVQPLDAGPLDEATVLLIGRSGAYPALSVAFGERLGVVGALSIEAAAKHLNARDLDGIVLGEGFSPRVIEAFLTVLAEDSRFRHLPVVVTVPGVAPAFDLPNLEVTSGDPAHVAACALPLIRQHAFENALRRILNSIDSNGLLDSRTGLLTQGAFDRDIANAVDQTAERGSALTVARFAFDRIPERVQRDAGRILTRLMRRTDFATLTDDGSLLVVFAETEMREAQSIAKRLSSVMKHTLHGGRRDPRVDPRVTFAALQPTDTAQSILARLDDRSERRAAS